MEFREKKVRKFIQSYFMMCSYQRERERDFKEFCCLRRISRVRKNKSIQFEYFEGGSYRRIQLRVFSQLYIFISLAVRKVLGVRGF